ncbi:galactose-binding domain-like protein, partial [Catenaria anguillulae PL171]
IVFATSQDDRFPASNAIDGNPKSFWTSTGLFPQELILQLATPSDAKRLIIQGSKLKSIRVYSATPDSMDAALRGNASASEVLDPFDLVTTLELPEKNATASVPLRLSQPVSHIKLVITDGYGDFVAVNSVAVE